MNSSQDTCLHVKAMNQLDLPWNLSQKDLEEIPSIKVNFFTVQKQDTICISIFTVKGTIDKV